MEIGNDAIKKARETWAIGPHEGDHVMFNNPPSPFGEIYVLFVFGRNIEWHS